MASSEYLDNLRNQNHKSFDALPGFKKQQKRIKIKEAQYTLDSDLKRVVVDQDYPKFRGMVYNHESMASVVENVQKLAPCKYHVFITGETGTGKEFVAHAIHDLSKVEDKSSFVAVNCAAIPEKLIESELFGVAPGAPGLQSEEGQIGKIELADNGTLFLDEIHTISITAQHKLFRFFTDSIITPIGTSKSKKVKVRVICASSKDLTSNDERKDNEVDDQFYFRVAQTDLKIPPVRDRGYDFFILLINYLRANSDDKKPINYEIRIGRLIDLAYHDWPGNVREIENFCNKQIVGQKKYFDANELKLLAFKDLNQLIDRLEKDGFSEEAITRIFQNSGTYIPVETFYEYMIDTIRTLPINQNPKRMIEIILGYLRSHGKTVTQKEVRKQILMVSVDENATSDELEKEFLLEVLKTRYQKHKTQEEVAKSLGVERSTINNWQKKLELKASEIKKLPKTDIFPQG